MFEFSSSVFVSSRTHSTTMFVLAPTTTSFFDNWPKLTSRFTVLSPSIFPALRVNLLFSTPKHLCFSLHLGCLKALMVNNSLFKSLNKNISGCSPPFISQLYLRIPLLSVKDSVASPSFLYLIRIFSLLVKLPCLSLISSSKYIFE